MKNYIKMFVISTIIGVVTVVITAMVLGLLTSSSKIPDTNVIWDTCFIGKKQLYMTTFGASKEQNTIDTYMYAGTWVTNNRTSRDRETFVMGRGIYSPKMFKKLMSDLRRNKDVDIRIALFEAQRNNVGFAYVNLIIPIRPSLNNSGILELSYGNHPNSDIAARDTMPTGEFVIKFPLGYDNPPPIIDIALDLLQFKTGINARKLKGPNNSIGKAMRVIFSDDSENLFRYGKRAIRLNARNND